MQTLSFGLKTFPQNIEFWLAMIDRLIECKNYSQAEGIIESAVANLGVEQR